MGLLERFRNSVAKACGVDPCNTKAKPLPAANMAAEGIDSDDSDGDMFALPPQAMSSLVPGPCPTRRGAMDARTESISDCGDGGRGCSIAGPVGTRIGGASLSGSEVDVLYSDVALIHRGRHAMIYRARERRSRRRVVLKAYLRQQRNPTRAAALEREQDMLRLAASHSGIVGLERVLESADATYLVLEAGTGGTLIEAIASSGGRLTEKVAARRIVAPLLRTLAHLHARGIVHRDLKPEHILLTQDGVRVIDFSTAARLSNAPMVLPVVPEDVRKRSVELRRSIEALHARHRQSTPAARTDLEQKQAPLPRGNGDQQLQREILNYRTGSVEYMAPEMLSKPTAAEVFHLVLAHGMDEEELPTYDEKVDVWSVGAVIFEAVTGFQPFLADGVAEMAAVVAEKLAARDEETGLPVFLARQSALSAECKDFVARCLEPKPEARLSASALLAHPWVSWSVSTAGLEASQPVVEESDLDLQQATRCMSDAGHVTVPLALPGTQLDTLSPGNLQGDGGDMNYHRSLTSSAAELNVSLPSRSKTGRL